MKNRLGIAIAFVGISAAATVALADSASEAVISMRQRLMDSNGAAGALAVGMIRGTIPFDPVVAAAAANSISHDNSVVYDLFPTGSDKGNGSDGKPTKASPDIWKNMADFKAISLKMVNDAKAAADAAAKGKDAYAAAFGAVGQNCQACHEKYRQS